VNRRNFILGVGTAATLSGAASVTGAALSTSVETAFGGVKVRTRGRLVARRNSVLTEQNVLSNNENFSTDNITWSKVGQDSPVNYNDFPQLYVNDSTNADLTIELATGDDTDSPYNNNLSSGGAEPYNSSQSYGYAPLEIENSGPAQKDVAVKYGYGEDVTDSSTALSKEQVAEIYRFHIDGTQVSPAEGSPDTHGTPVTFEPSETKRVDLNIQLSESTAKDVRSAAGSTGPYSLSTDGRAQSDLLDTAVFGEDA
jgi:hypothetical protein